MELENIYNIARKAGIDEKYIEPYGKYKAKVDLSIMDELKDKKDKKIKTTLFARIISTEIYGSE